MLRFNTGEIFPTMLHRTGFLVYGYGQKCCRTTLIKLRNLLVQTLSDVGIWQRFCLFTASNWF